MSRLLATLQKTGRSNIEVIVESAPLWSDMVSGCSHKRSASKVPFKKSRQRGSRSACERSKARGFVKLQLPTPT